jgi:hypothetical protein
LGLRSPCEAGLPSGNPPMSERGIPRLARKMSRPGFD